MFRRQQQQRETHLEEQRHYGTAPNNFPPEALAVIGQPMAGNLLNQNAAIGSIVFFTAPTTGYYLLSWALHVLSTDNAGTLTVTVTPPHAVPIPGVGPVLSTTPPTDGKGPAAPYYMAAGETVSVAVAAGSLGTTIYNMFVFAIRLF
jgi:hypothetical protein